MNNQNKLNQKGIAIGVIGPDPIVKKVKEGLNAFPSFIPMCRIYQQEKEAVALTEEILNHVEVILFAEHHVYRRVKEEIDVAIPFHYIPNKGSGLYRSLYQLNRSEGLHRLSVDSLSKQTVEQAFIEIGETPNTISYHNDSLLVNKDQLVEFHRSNVERGMADVVLTGVQSVSKELDSLGIQNEWVIPTIQDIIISLERALLSTETRRNKESQIVMGMIHINDFNALVERSHSEHEVQKLKLEIHRTFLDYVKCLDGHLTNLGANEYLFVTTRGIFERETRGYKFIPLLQESKSSLGISLSLGVGFGKSANEAGTHARLALRQSREYGGDVCFIVREDKSVIGPVEMANPMIYDLAITDIKLLQRAEKAGMTASYMSKLMAQVKRLGKIDYTAQELSTVLGVTLRSTHRILIQWLDAELVEIIGEEKITSKGRPRQIYRLSFVTELEKES
jgi:hypothetical protein